MHWTSLKTAEFTAYLELLMAARADQQLADLLIPATRAFEIEWMNEMKRAMPQLAGQPEVMLLANDLASAMHLGLLLNSPFIGNDGRTTAVRNRLTRLIEFLYREQAKYASGRIAGFSTSASPAHRLSLSSSGDLRTWRAIRQLDHDHSVLHTQCRVCLARLTVPRAGTPYP